MFQANIVFFDANVLKSIKYILVNDLIELCYISKRDTSSNNSFNIMLTWPLR